MKKIKPFILTDVNTEESVEVVVCDDNNKVHTFIVQASLTDLPRIQFALEEWLRRCHNDESSTGSYKIISIKQAPSFLNVESYPHSGEEEESYYHQQLKLLRQWGPYLQSRQSEYVDDRCFWSSEDSQVLKHLGLSKPVVTIREKEIRICTDEIGIDFQSFKKRYLDVTEKSIPFDVDDDEDVFGIEV